MIKLNKVFVLFKNNKTDEDKQYPPTFALELNRQCNLMISLSAIFCFFAWLPYIRVDADLHPEVPSLIFFRLGFTISAAIILILRHVFKFKENGYIFFFTLMMYLEIATAILTGLVKADTVYLSGYFLAILVLPLIPFSRIHAMSLLGISLLSFSITAYFSGASFATVEEKYNLNNLLAAGSLGFIAIYFLDKIRASSYNKSIRIQKEKEISDELLLNILPASIARELKESGSVKPVLFEEVSVLFLDFVGFTNTSEVLSPEKLISEVDTCFKNFDSIMEKYGLEKIKTIGDSYMCAGGVPDVRRTSMIDTVLAALDMKMFLDKHNKEKHLQNEPFWDFRIGIHAGPLISGVVGKKKFTYDIWGDTVNIASRIETASHPGEINISKEVYDKIKYFFNCEYRGKIPAKRKGEIEMYFVKGFLDELCDKDNLPNQFFWELYEHIENGSKYRYINELS